MARLHRHSALICSLSSALAVFGCGGEDEKEGSGGPVGGEGSQNGSSSISLGGDGDGDSGGKVEDGGTIIDGSGESCAGEVREAELIPLDIHVMLDKSGSMLERTGTGTTKWEAINEALAAFLDDPKSAGIGMGLHFFPPNEPCSSDADCSGGSWCHKKGCVEQNAGVAEIIPCQQASECGGGCVDLGICGANLCTTVGQSCVGGGGLCQTPTQSVCTLPDICADEAYVAPSLEVSRLPSSAPELLGELGRHFPALLPYGRTPMAPALRGAIDYAHEYARSHAGHKVVTVLATDGKPTLCAPQDEDGMAEIAAAGAALGPAIETYTIGVFSPGDEGPETVQAIAQAGGGESFIVDDTADVAAQFAEALNAIRDLGPSCDYTIPPSDHLDYGQVNVEWSDAEGRRLFDYVGDESGCSSEGGWYYDVADYEEETPSRITLCPGTCELQFSGLGQMQIRIGCRTVTVVR